MLAHRYWRIDFEAIEAIITTDLDPSRAWPKSSP